jgi:hypothetical protein
MSREAATAPAEQPAASSNAETVARLASKRDKWRAAARKLTEEREAARKEADELKAKVAELEKGTAELASLKAQFAETGHRARWAELAREAGIADPKAQADLWDLARYQPQGEPSDAVIKAAIDGQRTERPYLFPQGSQTLQQIAQQATQQAQQGLPPLVVPGPGRGQGGHGSNTGTKFQVSQSQYRDPAWCMANQKALAAAVAGGTLEFI